MKKSFRRGKELYEQQIRAKVETKENIGKLISIDVETGNYEIDEVTALASRRLRTRNPNAQIFGACIGQEAAYDFRGRLRNDRK